MDNHDNCFFKVMKSFLAASGPKLKYSKTCLKRPLKKEDQNWFSRPIIAYCRSKVLQNAPREHSTILWTCIKLPSVFETFVLSVFEWPLKAGFTVDRKTRVYCTMNLTWLSTGIVIFTGCLLRFGGGLGKSVTWEGLGFTTSSNSSSSVITLESVEWGAGKPGRPKWKSSRFTIQ